ncbi:hypothetical protein [Terrabacter sp. Soil810]|nr:hypothetical protein [Terrabacter sp. Soil810]
MTHFLDAVPVKAPPDDVDPRESLTTSWQDEADRPSFDDNADG